MIASLIRAVESRPHLTLSLADTLERSVIEHQPPLGVLAREADGDDAARLDAGDDALAKGLVADGVAGRELGHVLARRDTSAARGRIRGPRCGPQAPAVDALFGRLVQKARRQVVVAVPQERSRARVGQDEPFLSSRHADVGEPTLLL